MIDIIVVFPLFIILLILSKNKLSVIYSILSSLFYLIVMILYFHIGKNNGEFVAIFPDEMTYISGTSSLLFSRFVSFFFETIGPTSFRVINLLAYNLAIIAVLNRIDSNDKLNWFLAFILACGNYWSYFILKEGITVCGAVLLIFYIIDRKQLFLILGVSILILARPDFIFLLFATILLHKCYIRSKYSFYFLIIIGIAGLVVFYSLPISQPVKLSFISRRFEDVYKSYDPETVAAASLSGLSFITSSIYLDTIAINFLRAFSYLHNSLGLAAILVTINVSGLIACLSSIRKKVYLKANLFFLISNVALVLSHNTYRYANAVIIPYLLFMALEKKNESINNESKQH